MGAPRTWSLTDIPDQSDKIVVVTGANSGIGYVTARELGRRGAHVVLACRDPERGKNALDRMRAEVPDARLELRQVDLASLASIREFAAGWDHDRLDLLINNAGIAAVPFARTADGFESQFGVNHLGPFALTGLLLPHLRAAPAARVISVGSMAHRLVRFDLDNLNAERSYRAAFHYGRTKRAVLYFAMELQRRARAAGLKLRSLAVEPGFTRTNVMTGGANAARGRLYLAAIRLAERIAFRPPEEGAKTSLYAATVPDLPGGSYIVPDWPLQMRGEPTLRTRERALYDTETAGRVWELSERLTGVTYDLPKPG